MTQDNWYEMFSICSKLYNKCYHLMLSKTATTATGVKVGEWLDNQRNNVSNLTSYQIADLISIGMVWSTSIDTDKDKVYRIGEFHKEFYKYKNELMKYSVLDNLSFRNTSKILKLNENTVAPDGFNLFNWAKQFDRLRALNDDRYMTVAEVRWLKEIGYSWEKEFSDKQEEQLHKEVSLNLVNKLLGFEETKNKRVRRRVNDTEDLLPAQKIARYIDNTLTEVGKLIDVSQDENRVKLEEFIGKTQDLLQEWKDLNKSLNINSLVSSNVLNTKLKLIPLPSKSFNTHCNNLCDLVDKKATLLGIERSDIKLNYSDFKEMLGATAVYNWLVRQKKNRDKLTDQEKYNLSLAYPLWIQTSNRKSVTEYENTDLEPVDDSSGLIESEPEESNARSKGKDEKGKDVKGKDVKGKGKREHRGNKENGQELNLDKLVADYLALAIPYKAIKGYVDNSNKANKDLFELASKLMKIDYSEFSKDQIEELNKLGFIWLSEGGDVTSLKFVKTIDSLVRYIVMYKKTNMSPADNKRVSGIYSTYNRVMNKEKENRPTINRAIMIIKNSLRENMKALI